MRQLDPDLVRRLRDAGLDPDAIGDPAAAWRRLHDQFGPRATLVDRYALEAAHRDVAPDDLDGELKANLTHEVLTVQFPGAEWIPGSYRAEHHPIDVVDYDPAWPQRFDEWRQRMSDALGETAVLIEHVGSTAVPGLAAKPIIDIQVSVREIDDESAYVPQLEALDLTFRMRQPDHRYFRTRSPRPRGEHIHVCRPGSEWERTHLLFRDYLRTDDAARDAYATLKRRLAEEFRDDRIAYTDAKSAFILDVMDRARGAVASLDRSPARRRFGRAAGRANAG
jgi:GrpB-like predicted nucleotidyltransferase (UPF0157 family)